MTCVRRCPSARWRAFLLLVFAVVTRQLSKEVFVDHVCAPSIFLHVITCCRASSLERLLSSLSTAHYVGAEVAIDIHIDIDWVEDSGLSSEVANVARHFAWSHGAKTVRKRVKKAGLAVSWFELSVPTERDYIIVLEDDMELSPHYYSFIRSLHCGGALQNDAFSALCLHPNDWQIGVKPECESKMHSQVLYLTPEPCNWAPVWKTEEWEMYSTWLQAELYKGTQPYVSDKNNVSYNYNLYVDRGIDVQSPWVWRYNWETGKLQMRYSFTRCGVMTSDPYYAINHKEPGEHFKKKVNMKNDPRLLTFSHEDIENQLNKERKKILRPAAFAPDMLIPRRQ